MPAAKSPAPCPDEAVDAEPSGPAEIAIVGDLTDTLYEELGIIEIVSRDVSASLKELDGKGVTLDRIKIRQANLEDLFLDLTGHSLRA